MNKLINNKAWFPFGLGEDSTELRVFCLPFAGGGASFFRAWRNQAPTSISIVPVQYPGRETRLNEPCILDINELATELAQALLPNLDKPYIIAGYSLGAKLGFAVVHKLIELGAKEPELFIAMAHSAPDHKSEHIGASKLPIKEFRTFLQRYGSMSEQIFDDPELAEMFIPILRADIGLVECTITQKALTCPIIAYAGKQDEIVPPTRMQNWQLFTLNDFELRCIEGGHFFARTNNQFLSMFANDIALTEIIN